MQTVSIHDELAALRAENAQLRSDIAMRPGSLDLLYRIREACGFNQYYSLSCLDDDVRALRTSLLDVLGLVAEPPIALSLIGEPAKQARIIARARQAARGTGDVPQAAE